MRVYNNFYSKEIWNKVNQDNKDLIDDFLLELKQNRKSSKTISQYGYDLRGFMCHIYNTMENKSILELTKKDFRKYSIYLVDECKVSTARHNRVIAILHSLLDFAENDEDLNYDNNKSRKVKGLSNEPVKELIFLEDSKILSVYDKYMKEEKYQLASLLMLAYDSAGRKAELAQVTKYSFYDETKNNTNVVIGKGRKKFPLLYFHKTKGAVKKWLEQRGEDSIDSLWVTESDSPIEDIIYEWFVSMRPDLCRNFHPHAMRHSSLTNYSNGTHYICRELNVQGFSLDKLKLIAHHESIDTTQRYLPDTSVGELETMFNISIKGD